MILFWVNRVQGYNFKMFALTSNPMIPLQKENVSLPDISLSFPTGSQSRLNILCFKF